MNVLKAAGIVISTVYRRSSTSVYCTTVLYITYLWREIIIVSLRSHHNSGMVIEHYKHDFGALSPNIKIQYSLSPGWK